MGDDIKNTSILKLVFTDIDYKHTIIEDLCYEFDIDYDTYYEDDFSNRTTITPTRVDKVFWNKVYELDENCMRQMEKQRKENNQKRDNNDRTKKKGR